MVVVRWRVTAALLLPLLAGCVSTAEFRRLERDVQTMQKKDTKSGREQAANVSTQIDDLADQIKKLQGRIEVVENQSQKALQEARAARKEASARTAAEPAPPPSAPAFIGPPAPPTPSSSDLRPPGPEPRAAEPRLSDANAALSGEPAGPLGGEPRQTAAVPKPAESAAAASASEAPLGAADEKGAGADEVQSYRSAYAAWRSGDSEACIDQFRKFLQTHPASPYADDAAYWMADCYFKRGEYRTAILRFDDVVKRYPKGNKAADALYRQGEALVKSGPAYTKAARQAFEQVISEYPDTPRAAEAKKQIEQLGGAPASVSAPRR